MSIAVEVLDSLNHPIPKYGFALDHRDLNDYGRVAKHILTTLRRAGEWRANSVRFIAAGRNVGNASL
jgi:hypothetical protein